MSLEQRLTELLSGVGPLEPLEITLGEAGGCRLVGDFVAPQPVPHFTVCAWSGFAVRSGEVGPGTALTVVDRVAAGFRATQPVYSGVTVEVTAEAPLPQGSDAVVPRADATVVGDVITVNAPVVAGTGLIPAGGLARAGDVLIPSGTLVNARVIGLLASLGRSRVSVRPKPRIVIVTVGDGLLAGGAPLTEGLVYDSTGPLLAASALAAGALAYRVGPIEDEARIVKATLDDQLVRADLLIAVGGLGSPAHCVRAYLQSLRTVSFDEGSTSLGPFGQGVIGEDSIPVLSLPGDPGRASLLFYVLAIPMIRAMRGEAPVQPRTVQLSEPVARVPAVTQLLLGSWVGDGLVAPQRSPSPTLVDLVGADVIIRVLPGTGVQEAGTRVPALDL